MKSTIVQVQVQVQVQTNILTRAQVALNKQPLFNNVLLHKYHIIDP